MCQALENLSITKIRILKSKQINTEDNILKYKQTLREINR